MNKPKKMFYIKLAVVLILVIFTGIGGKFIYNSITYEPELDEYSSVVMEEGKAVTQNFTAEHSYLEEIAILLENNGRSGEETKLLFSIREADTQKEILTRTIQMEGIPDNCYFDIEIDRYLKHDKGYTLCFTGKNLPKNDEPHILFSGNSIALRYRYYRMNLWRTVACIVAIAGITIIALFTLRQKKQLLIREIMEKRIFKGISVLDVLMFEMITVVAIAIRVGLAKIKSIDYYYCYEPWIELIRNYGGLASLKYDIGDYPPLYMTLLTLLTYLPFEPVYIIKIMPCLFDFLLAFSGMLLLDVYRKTTVSQKLCVYSVLLLNPVTLLNASAWGQCDGIYSTFCILALALLSMKKEKWYTTGDFILVVYGIACSFKLQAIFFFPILCFIYVIQKKRCLKLSSLIWIPTVYALSCVPMFLAGRSLKVMFEVYFGQANRNYGPLSKGYSNFYNFLCGTTPEFYWGYFIMGILLTLILLLMLYYLAYRRIEKIDTLTMYKITAVTVFIICFFLPNMSERYAYLGEMILCILAVAELRYVWIAIPMLLCTMCSYADAFAYQGQTFTGLPSMLVATVRFLGIVLIVLDIFRGNKQFAGLED